MPDSATLEVMDNKDNDLVRFTVDNQGIAVLQVKRPHARNALNWSAQQQFADLVAAVSQDSTIRALIITGYGHHAFVSGGDLKELIHHPERAAAERLSRVMSTTLNNLTELPIPVIAAVNGDALGGGCEIVIAADLRIAVESARFSFAHVRNGLTTGWGGTGRLTSQIGQSRAIELLLTARVFSAEEAMQMGLLHKVISPNTDVLEYAVTWAQEIIALPGDALAATKALVYASSKISVHEHSQLESRMFIDLWETADHIEALAAFQQKRSPLFNQHLPAERQD